MFDVKMKQEIPVQVVEGRGYPSRKAKSFRFLVQFIAVSEVRAEGTLTFRMSNIFEFIRSIGVNANGTV